jgi:hypothetical protein
VLVRQAATETTVSMPGDKVLRFGEQIDIKVIANAAEKQGNDSQISSRQIAGYLAKYVTKSRLPQFVGTFRGSAERLCW